MGGRWWRRGLLVAAGGVALAVICAVRLEGQDARLAFDVATIRRSTAASPPVSISSSPGRFVTSNTSLRMLITWAFDLEGGDRLAGAPGWLDAERFDVSATVPATGPVAGERLKVMMRTLLAERFQLRAHHESREGDLYALVVEPAGARLKSAAEPAAGARFAMPSAGQLTATTVTSGMLARVLADQVKRTVEDRTGLSGVYDVSLEWEPEGAPPGSTGRPAIFTAIREQLGLRLEARRGAVEVLIIDSVERLPTAD